MTGKMIFAIESTYQEILPYFGTLDQVFVLMKSYNKKTSHDWDRSKQSFESKCKIKRKTLEQPLKLGIPYSLLTDKQKLVLSLFKLKSIHLTTVEKYEKFINFMTEVPDKFSLTFDKIYLGKGNCENVMHEANST